MDKITRSFRLNSNKVIVSREDNDITDTYHRITFTGMTNKNSVIFFVEGNRMKKLTYIKEKTDKLISWKAELDVPSTLDAEFCVIFVDGFIKNEIRLTVYKNGDVDYLHK